MDSKKWINSSLLTPLKHPLFEQKKVVVFLKRDDLLVFDDHPALCGNKVRKLYYNLLTAKEKGLKTLLTFGGAYSNHIVATASAGKLNKLQTIGIIRGEEVPQNSTLSYASQCGMRLVYVSRSQYREKKDPSFLQKLRAQYGEFYLIPEGGTNHLAIRGCESIPEELNSQLPDWDYLCAPCGTGGTLSGVIAGAKGKGQIIGFSALKGNFLIAEIKQLLSQYLPHPIDNWQIQTAYHFGGFAKYKPELITFMNEFKTSFGISLDPIYTGKMMCGLFDLIKKDFFPPGSKIIAIHTGGLQGISGFNLRFGKLLV